MKLIYLILDHAARNITRGEVSVPQDLGEYTDTQIHYHVGLCVQAGYLRATGTVRTDGLGRFKGLAGLTWDGHEALDELRSQYG